jgi:hypothetical protein
MVSLVEEGRRIQEEVDGLRNFLDGEERKKEGKKARACTKLSLGQVRNAFLPMSQGLPRCNCRQDGEAN